MVIIISNFNKNIINNWNLNFYEYDIEYKYITKTKTKPIEWIKSIVLDSKLNSTFHVYIFIIDINNRFTNKKVLYK